MQNDVLVNMVGVDNVTPVAQQIQSNMGGMQAGFQGATQASGGLLNTVQRLSGVFSGLNGLVMGTFGMFGLSNFKQMTYGYATARQELKSLHESVYKTDEASSALWEHMDDLTNKGYVQLDDLTQVMSNFGMSTEATTEQAYDMADIVNKVGNMAILMGKDSYSTMAMMQSAAGGVNGQLNMMRIHLGLTKDQLTSRGWSGKADDIDGYMKALDNYLSGIDTSNLLDSTEGRVISLQKRFRIAGRNIGNEFLPIINGVLDAFTKLNAASNDGLAKIVILGTGVASVFTSIIPTVNPILQTYQILNDLTSDWEFKLTGIFRKNLGACKEFEQTNKCMIGTNKLLDSTSGRFGGLRQAIKRATNALKEYIGIPVYNYVKKVILAHTEWIRTPLVTWLKDVDIRLGRVVTRMIELGNRAKQRLLSPFESALTRIRGLLGEVTKRLAGFIMNYSKLGTGENIARRMMEKGLDPGDYTKNPKLSQWAINFRDRQKEKRTSFIKSPKESLQRLAGLQAEEKQLNKNTEAEIKNAYWQRYMNAQKVYGAETTTANALATGEETGAKVINAGATEGEAIAEATNTAATEVGLWARIKSIGIRLKEIALKIKTTIVNAVLTLSEMGLLSPLLLIIGAITAIILFVNELGKQLGWWDNVGDMINAITSGLKRLWSAFINNPNVQGFIKDIQGLFGGLGDGIAWVTRQIMQFFGWKDDGSEVDIVRGIIDVFGALGDILGKIVNSVKWFFSVTAPIWSALFTIISIPVRLIIGVLKGIVCIIRGCSPGIIPAVMELRDIFMKIFPYIAMALGGPIGIIIGLFTGMFKNIDVVDKIKQLGGRFFAVARHIGLMLWNGLNSVLGGIPQKVWQTFWSMVNNIKQIPQMVFNAGKQVGQGLYDGVDNAVSTLTGGALHLPGSTASKKQQAMSNAKAMNNATKNYTNAGQVNRGHTINIGKGAIQLDARNLTTKESKQIMINALEGLTTYETANTKKTAGQK